MLDQPRTDVILGSGRCRPAVKLARCLIRLYVSYAGSFQPVTVEEPAKRSANDRNQLDQPRGTKCDQRLDTEEEPAVRHEGLSVGQVTPTRDPVFLLVVIPINTGT